MIDKDMTLPELKEHVTKLAYSGEFRNFRVFPDFNERVIKVSICSSDFLPSSLNDWKTYRIHVYFRKAGLLTLERYWDSLLNNAPWHLHSLSGGTDISTCLSFIDKMIEFTGNRSAAEHPTK